MKPTLDQAVQSESRQSPPPYGIIYNWDGAPRDYSEFPQSQTQFLDKIFAPVAHTQVGALSWSMADHRASWPSKNLETEKGPAGVYDSVRHMRHTEGLWAAFDRGENPYQAMVDRGHDLGLHVYPSIRMNDNHFWSTQTLNDMVDSGDPSFTQMRLDHPEWCLGENHAPGWCATSWNMAIPEVREYKLRLITEACQQADWDGVELDWQRHAFHLPEHDEYRLQYTLTDLQRSIRSMSDDIARQRGRPFHVTVRVASTMEGCRRVGYDVETWIRDGLCDIIIPAGCSGTDPGVEIEAFKALAANTPVQLYPSLDNANRQEAHRLMTHTEWQDEWNRVTAYGYWERGATGIYVFNWHANNHTRRSLLTTIGATDTLRRTGKLYAAVHRTIAPKDSLRVNAERTDRLYGETPVALYHTISADGPRFQIATHDNTVAAGKEGLIANAELQIEVEHYSPTGDKLEVRWDGTALTHFAVRSATGTHEKVWLVFPLSEEQATQGEHEAQVLLLERDEHMRSQVVIWHVEVSIRYKKSRSSQTRHTQ